MEELVEEMDTTPPDVEEEAQTAAGKLLTTKFEERYRKEYDTFDQWSKFLPHLWLKFFDHSMNEDQLS